jgi:ribosome recycling factor
MDIIGEILAELQANFDKAHESLKRALGKIRTGRANLAILDGVKVEYYGALTPLNQVASLQVADPRLITVKPWERSLVPDIERAIRQCELGLNPSSDGELVRLPIPPLTQERRRDLVKVAKKDAEEAKVVVRGHRRDANEQLKSFEKDGDITEDDCAKAVKRVQDATDKAVARVDEIFAKKEAEILEV